MILAPLDAPLRRALTAVGGVLMGLATMVLVGRFTGVLALVTVVPGGVPMAFTTAAGFLMAGLGFLAVARGWRTTGQAMGLAAAVLGGGTIAVYALAEPFGWDQFIYHPERPIMAQGVGFDGRMSPNAAGSFVLLGLGLFLIARELWKPRTVIVLGSVLLTVAVLALAGYLSGLRTVSAWWRYTAMATHSSAGFFLAGAVMIMWVLRRTHATERTVVRAFPFFALAASTLIVLGLIVEVSNAEHDEAVRAVRQSLEVKSGVERFIGAMARRDTATHSFSMTGEEYYAGRMAAHRQAVLAALDELAQLTADHPEQARRVASLREFSARNFEVKEIQVKARRERGVEGALAAFRAEPKDIIAGLRAGTDGLLAAEGLLFAQYEARSRSDARRLRGALAVGGGLVLAMLVGAFSLVLRAKRDLEEANDGLEERVAERTRDVEKAIAAARELEARFRGAIVNSPVPAILWAGDGRILLVNQVWQALSGYTEAELPTIEEWSRRALGEPISVSLPQYVEERFRTVSRSHDGEREIRTKGGEARYWDFHTASIGSLPGGERLLVTKAVDVTERRLVELRLRASEMSYRFLADAMPQMVWTTTIDGWAETYNRGWVDYTGLSAQESSSGGWRKVLYPGDEAPCVTEWQAMLGEGRPGGGEYRLRRAADGEYRWHLWRAHPQRDPAGRIERWIGTSTDIHEQKLLEAELEQRVVGRTTELMAVQTQLAANNRLQRAVLDGNTFAIIATKKDGTVEVFSRGAEQMLGYTAAEMEGKMSLEVIHLPAELAARAEELSARFGRRMEPGFGALVALTPLGEVDEREWTYVRKDGSRVPVRLSVSALRDPRGVITGYLGIAQDLTLRRRAEVALQASEERLLTVLKRADCLVWEAQVHLTGDDWDWHFVVQPSGLHDRLFAGLPAGESAGLWYQFNVPEQPEMNRRCREAILGGKTGYEQEFRLRRDGAVTWIRESVSISRPEEGFHWLVGVATDITAQRAAQASLTESEERFRQAFDYAGIGMAIVGLDGKWLRVNRTICEIVGYDEATLMRTTFQEITHPDDLSADMAELEALLAGKQRFYSMEKRYFHRAGHIVWIRLTASLVRDSAGVPVHFVSQIEDITAQKRLERNLAVARDEALAASRMKSEFLANMSHEIRTPMNAVVGMSGLLAETELQPDQLEMARTIQGGAEVLLTIINDILDFSKIEAGRLRLELADFDLRRVVEETVALLAPRAQERAVEVTCEFDPVAEGMMSGDGGRIRQVFTNLLGNAVKFTERGEIDVSVRVVQSTAQRVEVRVAVRDTGVGIAREAQAGLFQPFTQEDASTTRRFGGTGLGLAIAKQLVNLMQGEIGFESEQGRGSTFWFQLEFARSTAPVVATPVSLPPGRHVLVVDDNETNRRITLGQLARLGVTAEAVADGETALARLRDPAAKAWDAALLDWHMPGMNGVELAKEIRSDPELGALRLVMLSSAPQADVATAMAAGLEGFLTKPVGDGQLGRCLARVFADAAEPAGLRPGGPVEGGLRLRILLAEDNAANQRVATMFLVKLGHEVTVAVNGRQALERLVEREFDVVLMDCQMPVLDGYEATRQIRSGTLPRVNPRIPVIALTAYAMAGDRAKCLAAGMDDHVTKPLRLAELLAALGRCGFHGAGSRPAAATGPTIAAVRVLDPEVLESARSLPGLKGPSLLPELVSMYQSDEAERLQRLRQLADERAEDDLAQEAHAFAGNAASFGGTQVKAVALELEHAARAGDWPAVTGRLNDLDDACQRLRDEIGRLGLPSE